MIPSRKHNAQEMFAEPGLKPSLQEKRTRALACPSSCTATSRVVYGDVFLIPLEARVATTPRPTSKHDARLKSTGRLLPQQPAPNLSMSTRPGGCKL